MLPPLGHFLQALFRLRSVRVAAGLLLSLLPWWVGAQEPGAAQRPDVRLVIDVSGSMKRNDPNNLRQPAVDLLVRLVPDGGKAGVWTFGKYVNMLVPHQVVDSAWREAASRKSTEINSVGLFTNIGGALETAAHDMATTEPGYATSVILLTDGVVDISKSPAENEAEWRRVVDQVFPALKQAGYKVHAVALSEEADRNLMEKLAITTGGTFAVAKTADDLMKIFLQAFDLAVPSQKVALVNNRFLVDSSVDEFTALIFRQDHSEKTQLIGPDEVVIQADKLPEDVRWLRTEEYDLITVEQPYEGEWQIVAAIEPESRVTVVSNLALRVKELPSNVFRGNAEPLSFVLQGDGKPIADRTFLNLLESRVSLSFGETVETIAPDHWSTTVPGSCWTGWRTSMRRTRSPWPKPKRPRVRSTCAASRMRTRPAPPRPRSAKPAPCRPPSRPRRGSPRRRWKRRARSSPAPNSRRRASPSSLKGSAKLSR